MQYRIHLEENVKHYRDHQRYLILQEVVKKEVIKCLANGIVYLIFDSKWVSLIQVVPEKTGVVVI